MTRWPDFFIVGAPRCGTSSMLFYLDRHPEIFIPRLEPNYFGSDQPIFESEKPTRETYLDLFKEYGDVKRVGDKSVAYLYSGEAAQEIASLPTEPDIIIMLRSPLEMIPSLHARNVVEGLELIEDLGEALDTEDVRRRGVDPATDREHVHPHLLYTEMASYSRFVRKYIKIFGEDRVRVILFDDFVNDTGGVYRDTLAFLRVDPSFDTTFDTVEHREQVRSMALHRFTFSPPRFLRDLIKRWVPTSVSRGLLGRARSWNRVPGSREAVPRVIRETIMREVEADVEDLSKTLGRDLSEWLHLK